MTKINIIGEIGRDVTASSVESQLATAGDKVTLLIDSVGGSVYEGFKIYDSIRASGKEIHAEVTGICASIATVILLSAPLERRKARENARLLIHNPYLPFLENADAKYLETRAVELKQEEERMLSVYVQRTTTTAEDLRELMSKDMTINIDTAISLGFISKKIQPITAMFNNKKKIMKENLINALNALASALNSEQTDDVQAGVSADIPTPVNKELETVGGAVLTYEGEELVVGAVASPDGVHELPSGEIVTVTDGVVTDITVEDSTAETTADGVAQASVLEVVASLKEQVKQLQEKFNTLQDSENERVNEVKNSISELVSEIKASQISGYSAPNRVAGINAKAMSEQEPEKQSLTDRFKNKSIL